MKKAPIICFFALMFLSVNSFGQTEKFVKEYVYRLEDEDSKGSAKTKAQEELRKMLSTEVLGFVRKVNATNDLSSEDISVNLYKKAITANVRDKLKILDEKFDWYEYRIKGEVEADVSEINTSAAELKKKEDEEEAAAVHSSQTAGSSGQNVAVAIGGAAATAAINTAADIAQGAIGGAAANVVGNVAVGKLGGLAKGGLKGAAGAIGGAAANAAVNAAAGIAQDAIGGATQNIVGNIAGGSGGGKGGGSGGLVQEDTKRSKEGTYFVYSMRGEYVVMSETKGIGGCMEFGGIYNGHYFTWEGTAGFFAKRGVYGGNSFNSGQCFNKYGSIKNVLGITAGIWYFDEYGYDYNHRYNGISPGGVFWKIIFGTSETGNFGITNKLLFGAQEARNYHNSWRFNLAYSLSMGYTLTKKR
ncbi:MAG: hypothetical protein FWF51_05190 [Chitinivibrionia bacterium]|nr:hypothetical protein [Chitinivibrionia bacterium]